MRDVSPGFLGQTQCHEARSQEDAVAESMYLLSELGIRAWGLETFSEKVAFSWPSVDRFGDFLGDLMTLGQVQSVPNFCWFGQQRAVKRNFWRKKTLTLTPRFPSLLLSSVCTLLLNEGSRWEMSTAPTHSLHSAGCFPVPTELPRLTLGNKVCIKSPCTASTALLALIEVHGLLIQTLESDKCCAFLGSW